ncbi:MAG: recombinase family protein [Deltaproteobacteria bacterium]|nr:recombinase family protein [Deltaproteobacteria bacterium]MBT4263989.1 recombinase family protein [Deltaproteobacteria bacterium]MBT4637641.1 recombinase family protein [Deltaproteobacteria bacterium]MBT6502635.1 recombinase family protein [Deltaproteobacteria bacterium]MBT7152484.1 recombinase family protein [Deltaproteobacteria bacterium]
MEKAETKGGEMTTTAYIRISTEKQEVENQKHRINEYAAGQGIKIDNWIIETVSSRKADREIYQLIDNLEPGDKIIVTELSRLGRSGVTEVFKILGTIQDKKASLSVIQDGIEIDAGEMSTQAEVMVFALGIASKLERELISERTKAALKSRKDQGVKLGRPEGYSVLNGREPELDKYLKLGINKSAIAKLMGVSRGAVYNFLNKREA